MQTFRSLPLKLAVIDALLEMGLLKPELAAFRNLFPAEKMKEHHTQNPRKNYEPHPDVVRYFAELDLPAALLSRVKNLSFEGGNEIYRMITPDWDGEDDQFTVRDLSDLVHLPNLQSIVDTVLVDVDDAGVLLKLAKLSSVDVQYGSSIHDEKTIAALERKGIHIENKELAEKKESAQEDPELRLALDYSRAQDLLWDEDNPAAALEMFEKILAQWPRDADSWFEKGNALDALGKFDDAAAAWRRCLELKAGYPDANYHLANYYKKKGALAEAQTQIDAALDNGMKFSPEAWHIRGQLHVALGPPGAADADLKRAMDLYRKNLKYEEEKPETLFQMACVAALLQDVSAARDYLRQAVELDGSFVERARQDSDLAGLS